MYSIVIFYQKKHYLYNSFRGALYAAEIKPLVPDAVNAAEGKSLSHLMHIAFHNILLYDYFY